MSQQLIDHNPDLKKLRDEGLEVHIKNDHLFIESVPYVTSTKEVKRGTLISTLKIAGGKVAKPDDHVAHFIGGHPCNIDGSAISQIKHPSGTVSLGSGIGNTFSFSAKPEGGYSDYHHKMTTYLAIIESRAQFIDPEAKARTFRVIACVESESPFKYPDTASSRAGIGEITRKLAVENVGIIGLGGTGSYVLDFVAKTPVKEIHLFDNDTLFNHNAFRSPGAISFEELDKQPKKVAYFAQMYAKMRWKIIPHETNVNAATVDLLQGLNFVFICIDGGPPKRLIVDRLEEWGIPFIDVGMGVQLVDGALRGTLQVTASTPNNREKAKARISFDDASVENLYSKNIQIGELNALNATLAVIKWKKLCGFYHDFQKENYSAYTIDGDSLVNEDAI